MSYVSIIGLHVTDQASYANYRANMSPILAQFGGSFQYDFEVAKDLKDPNRIVNRLFAIRFPDKPTNEKFFSDPRYLEVRKKYFTPAVAAVHTLFEFTEVED